MALGIGAEGLDFCAVCLPGTLTDMERTSSFDEEEGLESGKPEKGSSFFTSSFGESSSSFFSVFSSELGGSSVLGVLNLTAFGRHSSSGLPDL